MTKPTRPLLRTAAMLGVAGLVGAVVWLAIASDDRRRTADVLAASEIPFDETQSADHLGTLGLPAANTLTLNDIVGVRTYDWDDLVPAEGEGAPVALQASATERDGMPSQEEFGEISADELMAFVQDIDSMRSLQPGGARIRAELDGQTVRIPGYITPVGFDDTRVTDFLLVPYLGACIHTPPPPANQIVYVTDATGVSMDTMWEPIWVTGVLRASPVATVLADVGYRIENARVEPYS